MSSQLKSNPLIDRIISFFSFLGLLKSSAAVSLCLVPMTDRLLLFLLLTHIVISIDSSVHDCSRFYHGVDYTSALWLEWHVRIRPWPLTHISGYSSSAWRGHDCTVHASYKIHDSLSSNFNYETGFQFVTDKMYFKLNRPKILFKTKKIDFMLGMSAVWAA